VGNDHSGNTQKLYTKQKTELTHCSNSQTLGKKIKPVVPSLIRSKNSSDTILKMEEEREISPMIETQKCRQIREKFEPCYQIENEESWEEFARATQFIK
jgi:D-arabinose 1-dehydrogenase-like Zn-dependent alcohol dehydrogenase